MRRMSKKPSPSSCAICEHTNRASVCAVCVNFRLNEYQNHLRLLKSRRDLLCSRLNQALVDKENRVNETNWIVAQKEKLISQRERLRRSKELLLKEKEKFKKMESDLKTKYSMLESANVVLRNNSLEVLKKFYPNLICTQSLGYMAITSELLHKQSVVIKQICKLFPQRRINVEDENIEGSNSQYDQICNARLPRGLDPHSVPSEELAASLGYMVQLLILVTRNLAAPSLHNSGFAGSCSRIWQRDSYWNARPSCRSNEYPLFIPRQNYCSNDFGVASIESDRKLKPDSIGSNSFNYSSASVHSVESHRDLQKGIALLKKSVACLTAYCYNCLSLEVPEASTFEAFAKLLSILSSSKEVRSVFSLKMASTRSEKDAHKSVWNVNSAGSSSAMIESAHPHHLTKSFPNPTASFVDGGKGESLIDGWDLVEHPTLPPPSHLEDIEHWTRAMFLDATKN